MFSVDTTNITFTAERLSVDLDQNSVPINGTYKDVTVPSAAADTQINQPVALNYDNIASNIYVAHEITWQVPGYSGRWDTWVKTFIMHKMSDGSYNYDVNGNLPPNPEGGSYVP